MQIFISTLNETQKIGSSPAAAHDCIFHHRQWVRALRSLSVAFVMTQKHKAEQQRPRIYTSNACSCAGLLMRICWLVQVSRFTAETTGSLANDLMMSGGVRENSKNFLSLQISGPDFLICSFSQQGLEGEELFR